MLASATATWTVGGVKSLRRSIALVLVVSSAAIATFVLRPHTSSGTWAEKLVNCAAGEMTEKVLQTPPVQNCMLEVMKQAAVSGQVLQMQEQLQAQIERTPALYAACHDISHQAGRLAFALAGDPIALLADNTSTTCQYGIGHGLLDGFAASRPSAAQYAAVAAVCSELAVDGQPATAAVDLCVDGMGHVAWDTTKDVSAAAHRCALFANSGQAATCTVGVIMQKFEPSGTDLADVNIAAKELIGICANWDEPSGTISGCFAGAGYIYSRPAWKLHNAISQSNGPLSPSRDQVDRLKDLLLDAARLCAGHGPGAEACYGQLAVQVPPSLRVNPDTVAVVCAALGPAEPTCVASRIVPG